MTNIVEYLPGLLPDAAITEAQLTIISQRTPREEVRMRPGKGGKQLAYVDHAYVTRLLNEAFGWNWDFEVDNEEILHVGERPFEVRCRGRLTVRTPTNQTIIKMQFGCQPIEMQRNDQMMPVSLGDAFKGAASDALKKCASLLGIALDLYDSDSDVNTAPAPRREPARYEAPQRQQPPAPVQPTKKAPTPDGARQRFFQYWQETVGGDTWTHVQSWLGSRAPIPTTVDGWKAAHETMQAKQEERASEYDAIEAEQAA